MHFGYGTGVFSWTSKKHQSVAQSSAEVEYVSATLATSQALWLRSIFEYISEKQKEATNIFSTLP